MPVTLVLALCLAAPQTPKPNSFDAVRRLGLPCLEGEVPACYSRGAREHTASLQAAIVDMRGFFDARLGIKVDAGLAVLDRTDWPRISDSPYGLPNTGGAPPVLVMPATSGGLAFELMMARKEAIPSEELAAFLEREQVSYETASDRFVDLIGFHELGHHLTSRYGIDPGSHFLDEFLATFFAYVYVSEKHPDLRRVFDLIGRPSKVRPRHTSLADFERLYSAVDDYGWYQGMFEVGVRQLYDSQGIRFLDQVRQQFPASDKPASLPPEEVVERLERTAPGFARWARGFEID